ncbi:LysR family transcriptional regulator [Amycolatopsis pigmentata]|uniref:LysR family transcriptional regulator n=1 Tax=Amycolatopsis pigmentata TaxID=450801 RepID=A0ABW5FND4_9PSEU
MKLDNRISLQKLEVFCLVVELGSVSRAAEKLFVTQPVVSAHLHSLEQRIGVALFRRVGRGIELTESGQTVCSWAQELLSRRDDLAQELDDLVKGTVGAVSLGSSMSVGNYLLPPILIDFRKEWPGASLTLTIYTPELALEAVRTGHQDFCVIAANAALESDALVAELIGKLRFVLVASPTDESVGDCVTVDGLRNLSWVAPPRGLTVRRSQDNALASLGVTSRDVSIEMGSAEAMKQAIRANIGVALLWEASVREDLDSGVLREVAIEGPDLFDNLYIVKHRSKRLTPLQSKLYARLRGMLDTEPNAFSTTGPESPDPPAGGNDRR